MERKKSNWKDVVFLTALFTAFTAAAYHHGWTHIGIWSSNIDPGVFIREAHEIVRTGEIITSRDPPLRYIPLVTLYWVFNNPTGLFAQQLASFQAAFFSFVVLPAGLATLAYVIGGKPVAYLTLIAFSVTRLVGFGSTGFAIGSWHYDIATPIVFLTLAAVHKAITASGESGNRWAVIAGVILGILGMTQWTLTLYTILVVTTAYLFARDYAGLLRTGVVGGVFATYLFFLPPDGKKHMGEIFRRMPPDSGSVVEVSHIISQFLTPRFLILAAATVAIVAHLRLRDQRISDSGVLEATIAVLYPIWVVFTLLRVGHIAWAANHILIPLMYLSGIAVVWQWRNLLTPINRRKLSERLQ